MPTETMIWDQSNETMERDELAQLQLERLQASIFRAYRNVAFYRKQFDTLGIAPEDIQSVADLRTLPFTTQEDLRAGYPYDMLAVPLREVVRLHNASWHTGRPMVCAYTRNDLRHWHEAIARVLAAAGVTRDDVVQLFFGFQNLKSGIGFHGGAERLGASVIPPSAGSIAQQIAVMQDFRTTVIVGTPSDAAQLAEELTSEKFDARRLSLRVGLFASEPWSEALRAHIEQRLGIVALDAYDLSEVGGPGVAGECPAKQGLHLAEDHYLAEIIDPATGAVLPEGETGELVLTTLTREALPLIRFRTHDITRLDTRPCTCGRTLGRIARIAARTDGTRFAQGVSFHPDRVEAVLEAIEGAQPHFQMILDRKAGVEEVRLVVEVSPSVFTDSTGKLLSLEQRIIEGIQQATGLTAKIRLVEPQTFTRMIADNPNPVIDLRV